jgi:CRISPR-associated exonuclease Cas4
MAILFAVFFLLALVAALVLLRLARTQQQQTGLPIGTRVVYADTGAWKKVERPLFSRRYGLTGKPDYIVEDHDATIPVEVKPNRTAPVPRASDVMQLAAYGLLIEESFGTVLSYGLLRYRSAVFQVGLTADLRAELFTLLDAMRRALTARDVARSHAEPRRCRACGYRAACGQALDG